ncbi:MAG: hypothetical protein QOJ56_6036, partial [Mycobacterium sp.]|nr:hypothetical protein [Mycobacterium sp.]
MIPGQSTIIHERPTPTTTFRESPGLGAMPDLRGLSRRRRLRKVSSAAGRSAENMRKWFGGEKLTSVSGV